MPAVGAVFNRTASACPDYRDPDRSGLETASTGDGKICAMPAVGTVFNRTASACPDYRDPDRSGLETVPTGDGRICAMPAVGAVFNRTASAQLETAPTKPGERKYLGSVYIFLVVISKAAK